MTFVDMDVDAQIRATYELTKRYFFSFTDHFDFALLEPKLEYQPDLADRSFRIANPAVYARQGIVWGYLDQATDLLIKFESGSSTLLTFGEFEAVMKSSEAPTAIKYVVEVFKDFHPQTRPVFARNIAAMAVLARALMMSSRRHDGARDVRALLDAILSDEEIRTALAWSRDEPQNLSVLDRYFDRIKRQIGAGSGEAPTPDASL